jgi:filamentous hemagglutinin family protein
MRNPCYPIPAIALLAWILPALVVSPVRAEVTVDGSLGAPDGPIDKVDNNYQITENLGKVHGGNLFHSFGQFSLNTGETATFTGPSPIQNILSRVTGGSTSRIDGTIRSTYPGANLYLMNPAGIVFGENARLDVKGSFHATTADYIELSDGVQFNAVPDPGSVLSSAPPEAFGFLEGNYAPISIQQSELEVPSGSTLSLIGGDIDINRSNPDEADTLVAPSGRVDIASVASPGKVVPRTDDLQMDGFGQLGTVSLQTPDAKGPFVVINTAGDPGGSVFIRSGRFVMQDAGITSATQGVRDHPGTGIDVKITGEMRLDRSEIASSSFGDGRAGKLDIAAGSLELVGDPLAVSDANPSGIYTDIGSRAFGAGDAGDLDITADELVIRNNAFINNNTLGAGRGGDIRLTSGSLKVLGEDGVAYVSTFSANGGTGDGGNLEVTADNIRLQRRIGYTGLTTQVNSSGLGNAGDIHIDAGRLDVLDGAEISTAVFNGPGNAGDLVITADSFLVNGTDLNGINASVSSSVFWNQNGSTVGDGGDIRITAHDLQVSDKGSITTRNLSNGPGDGGTIDINTGTLAISGGGFLSSSRLNFGTGRAGDININADDVRIAGPSPEDWPTGIFTLASVAAAGAGAVNIAADTVQVLDGAQINTRTFGLGAGGTVTLSANEVLVQGRDPQTGEGARIDARTLSLQGFEDYATGRGGDVQIHAGDLVLRDAGEITTASSSAGKGGDILLDVAYVSLEDGASISAQSTNTGNAGSIRITADDSVQILGDSSVTTAADISGGGRIDISARDLVYLLRSGITSSVADGSGNGGDITIDPEFVVLNDSRILASAVSGDGGNITIISDHFISSAESLVDASSRLGIDGDINIQSPDEEISNELAELPATYLDAAGLLGERCSAQRFTGRSSFVVGGRRGLPAPPDAGYSLSSLGPGTESGGSLSQRESAGARSGPGVLLTGMPDPRYSGCSW